ncbi:MAG: hypothetical protein ABI584_00510 [Acidobacteriota bacterium]
MKPTPRARSVASPARTTREEFGYHVGQSGARTSQAQTASGDAGVSISFATWTGARDGS